MVKQRIVLTVEVEANSFNVEPKHVCYQKAPYLSAYPPCFFVYTLKLVKGVL